MYLIKIHPKQSIIEGNGLFAGELIPKGTIVYLYSSADRFYSKGELRWLPEQEKQSLFRYGVEDEFGNWNMTETGQYPVEANHSCDANILPLFVDGIYCDIAVRDIHEGEEITIDYSMFYSSSAWYLECNCNSPLCRKIIGCGIPIDSKTIDLWHLRILDAIKHILSVEQPIFLIDDIKAMNLAQAIREKRNPTLFPYIKFSLISKNSV